MYRIEFILLCFTFCLSCSLTYFLSSSETLTKFEMAAINTTISSPVSITEEIIMNDLFKIGYKEIVLDKKYLLKIEKEVQNLEPSIIEPSYPSSFLFSGLLFFDNSIEGIYLSFTGYGGKYYMYYNKELYEWNQDLADLIYEKLPERIMDTVYDDMR